ncbi:MAG: dihydroorotate dehydrogenase-like protein [Deltaproteobacteria bacterium]|nr:dihydroorotate dehydrogenase-like protein [Deltaproteobacteria bacterium]
MTDLSTQYLGLSLENPIIVGSSGLTRSVDTIVRCEEAGAGAVVLKSVFEEQIIAETEDIQAHVANVTWHPEAAEYVQTYSRENAVEQYLNVLRDARKATTIPLIASVHCVSAGGWTEFAKRLENAGADAIELNLFVLPSSPKRSGAEIEQVYMDVLETLLPKVTVPISLKLGSCFSGMAQTLVTFSQTKLAGMVLFNRFRAPDIDIENMTLAESEPFSSPMEYIHSLRWISILSSQVSCDLAAATGIHDGDAVIKQLLAGATAVQVCSTLYKNGLGRIAEMKDRLTAWMTEQGFETLDDFRGNLSQAESSNPADWDRVQFMKMSLNMK